MVTTVGTESSYTSLVEDLLYLEHDAIAAYDQTIEKLENPGWKQQISEFRQDHIRHVRELTQLAGEAGVKAPQEGDMKQMLTTGKVSLASLFGDKTVLAAMKTNEDDTVTAYDRAARHQDAPAAARTIFERAHQDELRHRAWMETVSHG